VEIEIIRLDEIYEDCYVCGRYVRCRQGLPVYQEHILPNKWKDEWAGVIVCPFCYELFKEIDSPIDVYKAVKMLQIWLTVILIRNKGRNKE